MNKKTKKNSSDITDKTFNCYEEIKLFVISIIYHSHAFLNALRLALPLLKASFLALSQSN